MQPPYPSFTKEWHNDTYPAISPTKPELSQAGKTVIITGAGSGTGRQTAIAFAIAGAKHLILIGRTKSDLEDTKRLIPSPTTSSVFPCSVSDEQGINDVAKEMGSWDVLIMGAAHEPTPGPLMKQELSDWWRAYETNVKSIVIIAQAFFPKANSNASIFAITSGAIALPPVYTPNAAGGISSKVAQVKVMEFLAAENPDMFICSVHPGLHDTKIFRASTGDVDKLPMDTADLHANFMVWLAQPKNKFLHGRMVWSNWDVDQLSARAEEIATGTKLTIGYSGWPF